MSDNKFIKVIGVGNGGCNIVNNLYKGCPTEVSCFVCNTDSKALQLSPIPDKLLLDVKVDSADSLVLNVRKSVEKRAEFFHKVLNNKTRMLFVTAGMGGDTGTIAAPMIAKASREKGILTIGVVTTPFFFEGEERIKKAFDGMREMLKSVDTLLVINNELIRKSAPNEFILDTISKADESLKIAVDSISEIISCQGLINLDFDDLKNIMTNGGLAIISSGYGKGNNRINDAIDNVLKSQQFKYVDLFGAKKILLKISCSGDSEYAIMMDEINALHDFLDRFRNDHEMKWGLSESPDLKDDVRVTILATGFKIEDIASKEIYVQKANSITLKDILPSDNQIFISYKRTDKDRVFEIKNLIEDKIGNHCWIDIEGVESDAQFANVIIKAINQAKVFLFMYSSSHAHIEDYDNDWTVREINFAQKRMKRIVFVNIDSTPLTDWFELMFGTKQQVDANSDVAMKKLCNDMARWLSLK